MTTLKTQTRTLHQAVLAMRPENEIVSKALVDPGLMHSLLARVVPQGVGESGRSLFLVDEARFDGRPVVVVQTPHATDWDALVRERLVAEVETRIIDLPKFEEGVLVQIDLLAAAYTNHARTPEFAEHLKVNVGPNGIGPTHWQEPIVDDDACKKWFMEDAFAELERASGKKTGRVGIEALSCLAGGKRVVTMKHRKKTRITWVARRYSAIARVAFGEVFADKLAFGVGRGRAWGFGLVRAKLA